MSEPIQINVLNDRVVSGQIRIPGFQRGYVWDPPRVALLMDTIYKGYPYGTVLMWRSRERLQTEKSLGGFVLPEPSKGYPLDYVLDGQQRITSIFRTFQTTIPAPPEDPETWLPVYYDFEAVSDAQESQFMALKGEDVDPDRHFALRSFFDPVAFAELYSALDNPRKQEIAKVQARFTGALVPVQTFETDDRSRVAIVFERVNHQGIELNIFQLLTAWTWSEDFDLQRKFAELAEELDAFGFHGVGADDDLMMRCCAAILRKDPSPSALIDINGADMRDQFGRVTKALKLAIDFLRMNLHVINLKYLPYTALLIPLAAYFSENQSSPVSDDHRKILLRWFWATSFSHRYSGNPLRNVKSDVEEAVKLRKGEPSQLGALTITVDGAYYLTRKFNLSTVATKSFILQLARHYPKSFLSGSNIDLDRVLSEPNRSEYHHCYPRAYLTKSGTEKDADRISDLVNYAFLTRTENRTISDKAPSVYRASMAQDADAVCDSQLLPQSLFADDWATFRSERAEMLAADANVLVAH